MMNSASGGKKKKILVPIFYRAHLGRLRSVLAAIQNHPDLELQIIVGTHAAHGSFFAHLYHSKPHSRHALFWYVKARMNTLMGAFLPSFVVRHDALLRKVLEAGLPLHGRIPLFVDGGVPATMAKSVGFGMVRMIDELTRLKPDMIFIHADRFEMMAAALAAAYLNIPIAHNEAGDTSGTIDESVRHAITKFAHIHFAATEKSRRRVIQMGEDPRFVHTVGSPAIDALVDLDRTVPAGALGAVNPAAPYLVVLVHPVTTEDQEENIRTMENVMAAVEWLGMPAVLIGGNSDSGSRVTGRVFTEWVSKKRLPHLFATKWMRPDQYVRVLAGAACAIGNSSSFIREGAYFGTPAVLVGSRQFHRERGENAIEVGVGADEIVDAVRAQIARGRYPSDLRFGNGDAGVRTADILAKDDPPIQKRFYDLRCVEP